METNSADGFKSYGRKIAELVFQKQLVATAQPTSSQTMGGVPANLSVANRMMGDKEILWCPLGQFWTRLGPGRPEAWISKNVDHQADPSTCELGSCFPKR